MSKYDCAEGTWKVDKTPPAFERINHAPCWCSIQRGITCQQFFNTDLYFFSVFGNKPEDLKTMQHIQKTMLREGEGFS